MQKTNKLFRLLAGLLAVLMLSICIPVSAFADEGEDRSVRPTITIERVVDNDSSVQLQNLETKTWWGAGLNASLANVDVYEGIDKSAYEFTGWKYAGRDICSLDWVYKDITVTAHFNAIATTKEVVVNYYDIVNGKQVKEETITVPVDATQVSTSTLTLPEGYEFTVTGDLQINGGYVYAEVKPVATTKEVGVNYYDIVNGKQVKEETITVPVDATQVSTSTLTLPEGYEFTVTGDLQINGGYVYAEVKPVATTKEVGVNYYDIVNGKQVKEETITVPADATQVNTSTLTPPEGYEFTVTGDLQINGGYVYAEVKPVATTKEVGLNFYDEVNHRQVSEAFVQVDADATYVNTSVMTLPEGYEFISTGDLAINDGWVYVAVKPSENTRVIGLNYYDEVNKAQVREGEMVVDADAIHVNTSEIPALDGYEFTVTGDLAINDGWVYVGVKPVKSTRVVGLNYYDEVNDVQVCEKKIVVDADAINVNTSKIPALDGYEFIVTGDLQINDGWVYVAVKPAEGTRVVGLNYYDEVNQVQVCEKEMVVDADAIHVNTSEIPALDGYEFIVTGDLQINDGWVYVGVKPLETKTVGLNFFDEKNYEQVCEVEIEVPYNAIHLNTSEISQYLPEGYEFIELGDLSIRDGWVYVGVNCKWTLKIYWAVDNDQAYFTNCNDCTWTQELTWKHVNDDITMPEVNVPDGYVLNGWSVSGQEGEFWKPSLKTVNVGDKYVADENGGIISITANIVTKEEAESGSSDNSDDNSTTVTSTNSNNNNTQVVKAETPADNTAKVMPQTGLTAETPVVFGVMMVAALAGAGAYLFAIRKKLN